MYFIVYLAYILCFTYTRTYTWSDDVCSHTHTVRCNQHIRELSAYPLPPPPPSRSQRIYLTLGPFDHASWGHPAHLPPSLNGMIRYQGQEGTVQWRNKTGATSWGPGDEKYTHHLKPVSGRMPQWELKRQPVLIREGHRVPYPGV